MKTTKDDMIQIGPDWAIDGDTYCMTLYVRKISKKGKAYWKDRAHHNHLEQSLRFCIKKEIGNRKDLEDIVKGIDNLYAWLAEAIDSIPHSVCSSCGRFIKQSQKKKKSP